MDEPTDNQKNTINKGIEEKCKDWFKNIMKKWVGWNLPTKIGIIIGIVGLLIGAISLVYAFQISKQSSIEINSLNSTVKSLESELNKTQTELKSRQDEILIKSIENKDEILLALYNIQLGNLSEQNKEEYFWKVFNVSYAQAKKILEYVNTVDDFELGMRSLFYEDFLSSLYHFEMAINKNPNNLEASIGKAISLTHLNRTTEAIDVLTFLEGVYPDKRLIYEFMGDAYLIRADYEKAIQNYIISLEYYVIDNRQNGEMNPAGLKLAIKICEIKLGIYPNATNISVEKQEDGSRECSISMPKEGTFYQKYHVY